MSPESYSFSAMPSSELMPQKDQLLAPSALQLESMNQKMTRTNLQTDDTDLPSPLSLIFSLKPFFGDLAASASLRVEQEQRRAQEGFLPRERGESVGGRGEEREKEGEQQRSKD